MTIYTSKKPQNNNNKHEPQIELMTPIRSTLTGEGEVQRAVTEEPGPGLGGAGQLVRRTAEGQPPAAGAGCQRGGG